MLEKIGVKIFPAWKGWWQHEKNHNDGITKSETGFFVDYGWFIYAGDH